MRANDRLRQLRIRLQLIALYIEQSEQTTNELPTPILVELTNVIRDLQNWKGQPKT